MAEALRVASVLIAPIMPNVSAKILTLLGLENIEKFEGNTEWSNVLEGKTLGAQEILFPRPATE
jgi:methionyl-tRNA synthetase